MHATVQYHPCRSWIVSPRRALPSRDDSVYYTIPNPLLHLLLTECGSENLDPVRLDLDKDLAAVLDENPDVVGYFAGKPIIYPRLIPEPGRSAGISARDLGHIGCPSYRDEAEEWMSKAPSAYEFYTEALQAFFGWLMTNPTFVQERDELFARWADAVKLYGIPRSSLSVFRLWPSVCRAAYRDRERWQRFHLEFDAFYARWRLQQLLTKELPCPLPVQIPLVAVPSTLLPSGSRAVSVYLPDITPLPTGHRLEAWLAEHLSPQADGHLAEWGRISRWNRPHDREIEHFARVFILHHFWTVVARRYPTTMAKQESRIKVAFARFLDLELRTLCNDLKFIKERLGVQSRGQHGTV